MAKKTAGSDNTDVRAVTTVFLNNSLLSTANKAVDYVVINNAVVPDPNQINPGVIINAQQTK